jgi:transcriptional regulator GlxA family with amidase domain
MRLPPSAPSSRGLKTIVLVAAPDTQILDVTGPFEVFVRAARIAAGEGGAAQRPYRVVLASTTGSHGVTTNCGLMLMGSETIHTFRGPIDTLLVVGGTGVDAASQDVALIEWLRTAAVGARRVGSVCTGAFVLAAAGLLHGKRVATHWKWADALAERYTDLRVDADALYVRDGNLYTTAGVTAGMDLALALVEDDLGAPIACQVARELVLAFRRPGGQSQLSAALTLQASDRRQIEEVRAWVIDHLHEDLRVEHLATRAAMSPRHFARVFRQDTGTTPARYIERLRVEAAQRRLQESGDKLDKIAKDCGLRSIQGLRRAFVRVLHEVPTEYRQRFTPPLASLPAHDRRRPRVSSAPSHPLNP